MRGTRRAGATLMLVALIALATGGRTEADARDTTLWVPQEYATVADAIEAARPGEVIVLDRGTYPGGVVVPEDRPGITVRGVDRNAVVMDGQNMREHAIEILADDVTVENLSVHDFTGNGVYWEWQEGFAGRYLTVWNVGLYGIYTLQSEGGVIEHSLVSGAADAAFYIGECQRCEARLSDVVARLSAVGYSGTNASGVVIEDSLFDRNGAGILPNSYDVGLAPPPEGSSRFERNVVTGSGTEPVPVVTPLAGFVGLGIGIAGGVDNVVEGNEVTGSTRYGIVVFPTMIDPELQWVPEGNLVRRNVVTRSGVTDLALSAGSGPGNCFEDNTYDSSSPEGLDGAPCDATTAGPASDEVASALALPLDTARDGPGDVPLAPFYAEMPTPADQPSMPGTGSLRYRPRTGWWGTLGLVGCGAAIGAGSVLLVAGGRRIRASRTSRRVWPVVAGSMLVVLGAASVPFAREAARPTVPPARVTPAEPAAQLEEPSASVP
jgi:Right handed beta helix region